MVWEDDDGILLRTWLPKRQSREPYPSYIAMAVHFVEDVETKEIGV